MRNGGRKPLTQGQVVALIREKIEEAGSLRQLAIKWGISAPYLSDVVNGRRAPGPKITKHLGLKGVRTVTYEYRCIK